MKRMDKNININKSKIENEGKIRKIENGTVIDHIKAGSAFKVLKILGIDENYKDPVMVLTNAKSKILGKKDIVKLENRFIDKKETDKISLISENTTINIIKNGIVTEKYSVEIPKVIDNILICPNVDCITNHESIPTKFYLVKNEPLTIKCHYCERVFSESKYELKFKQ